MLCRPTATGFGFATGHSLTACQAALPLTSRSAWHSPFAAGAAHDREAGAQLLPAPAADRLVSRPAHEPQWHSFACNPGLAPSSYSRRCSFATATAVHVGQQRDGSAVQPVAGSSSSFPQPHQPVQPSAVVDRDVLYKGKWMREFRLLVRFKIFQLAGVAALAVPINTFLAEGAVAGTQLALSGSLLVGCGVASYTLWYYSGRYVGELSMVAGHSEPLLCFSVMDFWGRRQNNLVPLSSLVPPLQSLSTSALRQLAQQPLIPVNVSGDKQYYLSLRHGQLLNKEKLFALLRGQLHGAPMA